MAGPWWAGAPYWLRITRNGNAFSTYTSENGTAWSLVTTETVVLPASVRIGLAVCAHDLAQVSAVEFTVREPVAGAP